jgi:hypothetical protein
MQQGEFTLPSDCGWLLGTELIQHLQFYAIVYLDTLAPEFGSTPHCRSVVKLCAPVFGTSLFDTLPSVTSQHIGTFI